MYKLRTGGQPTPDYYRKLSRQLLKVTERYALGTQETEELLALASTVMENHSQSTFQVQAMLIAGLRDLSWISSSDPMYDRLLEAVLMGRGNVRFAAITNRPGKQKKLMMYLKGYEAS